MVMLGFLFGVAVGAYGTHRVTKFMTRRQVAALKVALATARDYNMRAKAILAEDDFPIRPATETEQQQAIVDFDRGVRSEAT